MIVDYCDLRPSIETVDFQTFDGGRGPVYKQTSIPFGVRDNGQEYHNKASWTYAIFVIYRPNFSIETSYSKS